ncbi:DNA polymerase III subunit delta' [Crenobacter sp. SG2305]|uniref:DNA polymerase III subunit delta' n=1 Tax=Crenobacter oryzisoli TaxID=3056844 RepID=UPI0025AB3EA0|nr:DNA polymerase III subunit delta' [Crenobacter sp. SG2305]MDN0084430.1 DNA polymerase III subunit delta' [Crenobacter sp. SG2305]
MSRLPWQADAWQQIRREFGQLPNAWLFTGPAGIGKRAFAESVARALLCESPTSEQDACGHCQACHWLDAGSHPDFRLLSPDGEEEGEAKGPTRKLPQIKVEAVREVIDFAHLTAHRGGRRVVLVDPAEAMNLQAANALLKILEEPPANVLFLLVSHAHARLLPTIKSRCRQFPLTAPDRDTALAWLDEQGVANAEAELALHGGSPLFEHDPAEAALRRDFVAALATPSLAAALSIAEQVDKQKQPLALPLSWLAKWLSDLAGLRLAGHIRYYPDQQAELSGLAERVDPAALLACYDRVLALIPFGHHTLNVRLQLEALLMDYLKLFAARRAG